MTLGTSYAAGASERLSIYPGRTCGFAAEIFVSLTVGASASYRFDLEEDRAARAVVSACSVATRSRSFAPYRTSEGFIASPGRV
jgi:hypothetical protein